MTMPFDITVAPLTFGHMELVDDVVAPIEPVEGLDIDEPAAWATGCDPLAGWELLEPVAIAEPFVTDSAEADGGRTVPASATPPMSNVPARQTAATPDHHNLVAGFDPAHRALNRSIGPVMMCPPVPCPLAWVRGSAREMILASGCD
jgi:hypothetical protein